jgi:Type II CAAX prenyl endopeptidase Rce1-like
LNVLSDTVVARMDPSMPATTVDRGLARAVVATLVIGGYMALGFALGPSANGYLLLGIPISIAFDPYLHGSTPGPDRASAIYGSALWGLWHLPVMSVDLGLLGIPYLLAVHTVLGYVLVGAWRRTGNLAAPGIAHAVAGALRNAVAVLELIGSSSVLSQSLPRESVQTLPVGPSKHRAGAGLAPLAATRCRLTVELDASRRSTRTGRGPRVQEGAPR